MIIMYTVSHVPTLWQWGILFYFFKKKRLLFFLANYFLYKCVSLAVAAVPCISFFPREEFGQHIGFWWTFHYNIFAFEKRFWILEICFVALLLSLYFSLSLSLSTYIYFFFVEKKYRPSNCCSYLSLNNKKSCIFIMRAAFQLWIFFKK